MIEFAPALVPLLVTLPLLGAAIALIAGRHRRTQVVVSVSTLSVVLVISAILLYVVDAGDQAIAVSVGGWPIPFGIVLYVDRLAALLVLVSSLVLLAVLLFSVGQGAADGDDETPVTIFHPAIVVSVYLLFVGHNAPGGGFAGGLVAGMALVMRYVAGGRYELGAAAPTDAGRLLGIGMSIAVACAIVPLFFGAPPLTSTWFEAEIPVIGHIEFVTSTLFDVGVYLVVIGLVLDVLRSLGAEVDRQAQEAREGRPVGVSVS
jgi:multisubunit Na+/H+ antiporter MnhB subunit